MNSSQYIEHSPYNLLSAAAVEASDMSEELIKLDNIIGQKKHVSNLQIMTAAAKMRNEAVDHILLSGPAGSGRKTIAKAVANEMKANLHFISAETIKDEGKLANILSPIEPGDIIVFTDFEQLRKPVIDVMIPAMRDFELVVKISDDKGPSRGIRLDLPPFTIVAITSDINHVHPELLDSFGIVCTMLPYSDEDMVEYIERESTELQISFDQEVALMVAKAAEGRFRNATRLLKRMRDFAQVNETDHITSEFAETILQSVR